MRIDDWPQRLTAYVEQHREVPFAWGRHDCCTFAAGWVTACIGTDFDYPAYKTASEATRLLHQVSLDDWATAVLGEQIRPVMAKKGDIVISDYNGREGFGIVIANGIAAPGEQHLLILPRDHALRAWRVD